MPVYEFPLNEKMRNYLRIEDLMANITLTSSSSSSRLHIQFFEHLFTLLDLLERIDIRSDVIKDLDVQERNLVLWSQHPNIDNTALSTTLKAVIQCREGLKTAGKPGTELKADGFLQSIRQRFAIPGATCSFDLPQLHFWLGKSDEERNKTITTWLSSVILVSDAISMLLDLLRQRSQFVDVMAKTGFYQGNADDKNVLIRIKMPPQATVYPTLSGNKYRYALRFMEMDAGQSIASGSEVTFSMAACK